VLSRRCAETARLPRPIRRRAQSNGGTCARSPARRSPAAYSARARYLGRGAQSCALRLPVLAAVFSDLSESVAAYRGIKHSPTPSVNAAGVGGQSRHSPQATANRHDGAAVRASEGKVALSKGPGSAGHRRPARLRSCSLAAGEYNSSRCSPPANRRLSPKAATIDGAGRGVAPRSARERHSRWPWCQGDRRARPRSRPERFGDA
jgi:hypothetical protein